MSKYNKNKLVLNVIHKTWLNGILVLNYLSENLREIAPFDF